MFVIETDMILSTNLLSQECWKALTESVWHDHTQFFFSDSALNPELPSQTVDLNEDKVKMITRFMNDMHGICTNTFASKSVSNLFPY